MTNADKFKSLFGLYATELWAMSEKNFLKWLNSEVSNCSEFPNNSDVVDRQKAKNAICSACGKIDCDEMDTCEKLDIPSEGSKPLQPWEVLVAQAVLPQPEIVRCKDCKYHYKGICPIERYFSLDGFCSRGKKREVTT